MVVLRWGEENKEGKSHRLVMEEVSLEINLEGQEGACFLAAQGHIISEAVRDAISHWAQLRLRG